MSLRLKVASVVAAVSLGSFCLVFFVVQRLLLAGFLRLENGDLSAKVAQITRIIEGETKNLERIVADWAFWDDTYRFIGGEYPEYVDVNCTDDVFPNLGIHFLGLFDLKGNLYYGKSVDPGTQKPFPLPRDFVDRVRTVGMSLSPGYLLDRRSGLLLAGREMWLFALSWILPSDLSGPPRGFFVMARKVDEAFLGHLADLFGRQVAFEEVLDKAAFASLKNAGFTVQEVAPFLVRVAVPVPLASKEGGLALTFLYRRSFLERGQRVSRVLLFGHAMGSAAIFLLLFLFVENVAVRRILRLASFLKQVRTTQDFHLRASVAGQDEVAVVGEAVNEFLEEIERRTRDLAESESRFWRLFEGVPVGVYQARFGGEILEANPRMLEILGCSGMEELRELGFASFRQDVLLSLRTFEDVLREHGEIRNVVSTWKVRDGSLRFLRESARVIGDEVYEGTLEDVTEEVLAREDVRRNEMYYRILLEYSSDGVVVLDREGRIRFATSSVENVTGYTPEEVQGLSASSLLHPEDVRRVERIFLRAAEGMVERVEFRLKHRNGEWRTVEAIGRVLFSHPLIQGVVVTIRDITERKRVEEAIRLASFRDVLTGLYNRAYFEEELRRSESARLLPLSIVIGDVNGLKIVNDAFGHAAGDHLLKVIADVFQASCRKEDVVARWGGDEFAVILPRAEETIAREICARIRRRLEDAQTPLPASIALGWATRKDLAQSLEDVLREAEERMYREKLAGRERFFDRVLGALENALWRIRGKRFFEDVAWLARRFAEAIRLPEEQRELLLLLARFFDVGVVPLAERGEWPGLPEEIFLRRHTESGYFIATNIPLLAPLSEAILAHEEWWNGEGLPRGLRGEEIPLLSRIIALCVAFLERPRREGLAYIEKESGRIFDPFLAREFLSFVRGDFAENGVQKL